ncbi:hypothetical protein GH733_005147, partial [Mirounga leonina]
MVSDGSKDGKYELFTAANEVIAEEIKDLMTKSDIKGHHTETLLAGSLAKALCCILGVLVTQKACDITGGLYLKVPQMPSLLQYLLWVFLPDQDQRSQLILPPPVHVDYRAACFCHRNLIEIGYVCSVCLSIFCSFSPICTTCETAFKISLPPVLKAKKKKLKVS